MIKFNEWLKKKSRLETFHKIFPVLDEVGGATSVVWGHNKKNSNVGPDAQAEGAPWSMNMKYPSGVEKPKKTKK